ncbi:hypothetical protein [Moorena sp. SIO1F2]|uniref:hypothetical protein n=1 Tax=Moorena sp. SIO1F2 TaxID=2607819 RepID=UPI0025EF4E88|nr:hypothetical protein [Moorena sp. SIO1F2]
MAAFNEYCTNHKKSEYFYHSYHLGKLIYYTQEIILEDESLCLIIRPKIAAKRAFRLFEDLRAQEVTPEELLNIRDRFLTLPVLEERGFLLQ